MKLEQQCFYKKKSLNQINHNFKFYALPYYKLYKDLYGFF